MATTPCPGLQHETGDGKPSGYVANGEATKVIYQPEQFGDTPAPKPGLDLGFGRFRLHAPINKPEYYDEMCVFLGASYFRAMAEKGEQYGLSACGFAINIGQPKGEEILNSEGRVVGLAGPLSPCAGAAGIWSAAHGIKCNRRFTAARPASLRSRSKLR